jgi:hypothetical protein
VSSPLDGLSGLEVMIPPIVGVTVNLHGTPAVVGCLPDGVAVRSRQRARRHRYRVVLVG